IDRVRENASSFHIAFEEELHRVMIHGVLHLCGYDDHQDDDFEEDINDADIEDNLD
ncbi:MAG: rRNA maturation RNAse YbeY, partial [Bacteroidota bacterium]